jgi:hypothetical protein
MTMSAHELAFVQQHSRPSVRALRPRLCADRDLYYSQTVAPTNVDVPAIMGTPTVGRTLETTMGNWNGTPVAYGAQWKRGGVSIPNATFARYLLVQADSGQSITCTVTAFTGGGQASVTSSPVAVT